MVTKLLIGATLAYLAALAAVTVLWCLRMDAESERAMAEERQPLTYEDPPAANDDASRRQKAFLREAFGLPREDPADVRRSVASAYIEDVAAGRIADGELRQELLARIHGLCDAQPAGECREGAEFLRSVRDAARDDPNAVSRGRLLWATGNVGPALVSFGEAGSEGAPHVRFVLNFLMAETTPGNIADDGSFLRVMFNFGGGGPEWPYAVQALADQMEVSDADAVRAMLHVYLDKNRECVRRGGACVPAQEAELLERVANGERI